MNPQSNRILINIHNTVGKTAYYYLSQKWLVVDPCSATMELAVSSSFKSPPEKFSIPITDVIAVRSVYKKSQPDPKKFQVIYSKPSKKNVWRPRVLKFRHSDPDLVIQWVQTMQSVLNKLVDRPKRILMFVNPYGGRKNGVKICENYARPLFEVAGVELTVVVTKRRNEIRDTLLEMDDLDKLDAVVCVGGDGTASEAFTGLVLRECRLRGINADDPGSTDTTSYCLHGTTDTITALLHIIMGVSLGLDLTSVHYENRLLQMCSNVVSYGFLGDIIYHSEKLRWMGPTRYEYVGAKKLLRNGGYKGTVTFLGHAINENETKCYENCNRCGSSEDHPSGVNKWSSISSNFFLLAGANISCAGTKNPHGLAPYCHLGDGYLNVLLVHHTSLYQRLRTLQRMSQSTYSLADLPHVEVYRGKEFRFKADGAPGRWNCDGEPILDTDICVKVHRQLINVYSRGIPES
ncbi:hypothetical protein RI129_000192 [Pyrocoelia pectoralis]|uniref:DAGKc domain-containing protein n=1 Tax=Pyrocoelia pectoralis TaxID=417401 RepID=A0AAN7V5N2_9COLE